MIMALFKEFPALTVKEMSLEKYFVVNFYCVKSMKNC